MGQQRADNDVHWVRRLVAENVPDNEADWPSQCGCFPRRAGGPRVLVYTDEIELKSVPYRPMVNLAQHIAESAANVDDRNRPVRWKAARPCELFEESQRRLVGACEVIYL